MTVQDPFLDDLWRFIRGDAEPAEFEQWIYAQSNELESRLGSQLTLDVLSSDFRFPEGVSGVIRILREYAEERVSDLGCRCITLPNVAVIDMGEESKRVLATIEKRRSHGRRLWWLWCGECTCCGQWWLVGQEERQNDVYCLRRLAQDEATALIKNGIWPPDFDSYETMLRLGLKAGKSVGWVDPVRSYSLRDTIVDLAKARPGIRVSELAELLNLEIDVARSLAVRAVQRDGAAIDFD